jgi:hypothetical protein
VGGIPKEFFDNVIPLEGIGFALLLVDPRAEILLRESASYTTSYTTRIPSISEGFG